MATLYISEFSQGVSGIGTTWAQMLPQPSLANQAIAIGGASAPSAAFNVLTKAVLISADAACSINFGAVGVVATAANFRLPANTLIAFAVPPGGYVACIANP